jgi:hypothetical protein
VADVLARVARVHSLEQHQPPGLVQPENFLELERAHRGHGLEALMEGRSAHVARGGHFLDRDGLREVRSDEGHGFGNPLHAGLRRSDLGDTSADRSA